MERYDAVTMDDLRRVSAEVLSAEKVLAVIGPFTPEKLEFNPMKGIRTSVTERFSITSINREWH